MGHGQRHLQMVFRQRRHEGEKIPNNLPINSEKSRRSSPKSLSTAKSTFLSNTVDFGSFFQRASICISLILRHF